MQLVLSRAPHGARGLKHNSRGCRQATRRRAPHGARGLKHFRLGVEVLTVVSRPTRGAWIETHPWQ